MRGQLLGLVLCQEVVFKVCMAGWGCFSWLVEDAVLWGRVHAGLKAQGAGIVV